MHGLACMAVVLILKIEEIWGLEVVIGALALK